MEQQIARKNKCDIIKEIEKELDQIGYTNGLNSREILNDWSYMFVLSLPTMNKEITDKRSERYENIAKKYTEKDLKRLSILYMQLLKAFQCGNIQDYLGELYMRKELGSKGHSQCFTPFNVAEMMAMLTMADKDIKKIGNRPITISDPCCGAGVMSLAYAKVMKDRKINISKDLLFVCEDIDQSVLNLAIIQLSLLNVPAVLVCHDVLTDVWNGEDGENVYYTPAYLNLLKNACYANKV